MMVLAHGAGDGPLPGLGSALTAAGLLVAAWLFLDGALAVRAVARLRTVLFLAGLAVVGVALLSPIETYADDLLVVHVAQHVLLVLVAAPLLVLARPLPMLLRGLPSRLRSPLLGSGRGRALRLGRGRLLAPAAAAAHVLVLWGGHVPVVYDAVLRSPVLHGLEHALLLSTGALLWWAVLDPAGRSVGGTAARLVAVASSAAAGIVLGVALLSSPRAWYEGHEQAWRWGLAPLDDQHAAGALMWAAGGPGYALAGALVVVRVLRREPRGGRSTGSGGAAAETPAGWPWTSEPLTGRRAAAERHQPEEASSDG